VASLDRPFLARLRTRLRRRAGPTEPAAAAEPGGASAADQRIIERALPYTMTGVARLQALIDAVRYCERRGIPGAFVECGVWRGGSVLAMILVLQELGRTERDVFLFDSFEGMPEPGRRDTAAAGEPAKEIWEAARSDPEHPWRQTFDPRLAGEDAVRETVLDSGYPAERVHLVRGPVEETLPSRAPQQVALLRLDTDWYQSTRHELEQLYPRLSPGGVLIVDDYGHWQGCREAVDEYFERQASPLLLNRIDYTGRIAIKH
jgi:O-methyltransferase